MADRSGARRNRRFRERPAESLTSQRRKFPDNNLDGLRSPDRRYSRPRGGGVLCFNVLSMFERPGTATERSFIMPIHRYARPLPDAIRAIGRDLQITGSVYGIHVWWFGTIGSSGLDGRQVPGGSTNHDHLRAFPLPCFTLGKIDDLQSPSSTSPCAWRGGEEKAHLLGLNWKLL